MLLEIELYLERYQNIHDEMRSILENIGREQLDWSPAVAETNSIAVLMTHMLGAEQFRIHQLIGGIDVHRDRDSEFAAVGVDPGELTDRIQRVGKTSAQIISQLTEDDLAAVRQPLRSIDQPATVRSVILHIIEHSFLHLGHVGLTTQLYMSGKPN